MKLVIAGSRDLSGERDFDLTQIIASCERFGYFKRSDITEFLSGGARGVDMAAEDYARYYNLPFRLFAPDWNYHGKAAGLIRNTEMAQYADHGLIIWDGKSTGTQHMMAQLTKYQKPYVVFTREWVPTMGRKVKRTFTDPYEYAWFTTRKDGQCPIPFVDGWEEIDFWGDRFTDNYHCRRMKNFTLEDATHIEEER